MERQGEITRIDARTGRFALRLEDGSYVLAEQLGVEPLQLGKSLSGQVGTLGTEMFTDVGTAAAYEVNVLAYDLSLEAIEEELR